MKSLVSCLVIDIHIMSHHHVHPHPLCPPSQRCHRTFFAVVTVFILIPKPILIRCPYAALAIALASLVRSALFLLPFLVWLHSGRLPKMRGLQTSIINAFTFKRRGTSCKGSSNIFEKEIMPGSLWIPLRPSCWQIPLFLCFLSVSIFFKFVALITLTYLTNSDNI